MDRWTDSQTRSILLPSWLTQSVTIYRLSVTKQGYRGGKLTRTYEVSDRLCCIRWQSCSVTAATWQSWQCQVLPDSQLTSHGDCTQPIIVVWPTMSCFADWSKCCHVTFIIIIEWSRDQHHCKLSQLISINLQCVTTVLIIKNATVSKSQNVKDRSRANKYLRKIKVNLRSKVGLCISTYRMQMSYVTARPSGERSERRSPNWWWKLHFN